MVAQFTGFGIGPQLMKQEPLMRGQTLDGKQFTVSKMTYNSQPFPGASGNDNYVVDVHGDTSYGFASEDEAVRFVHSMDEEEYTAHDNYGQEGKKRHVGLGVPEGMVVRSNALRANTGVDPLVGSNPVPPSSYENVSRVPLVTGVAGQPVYGGETQPGPQPLTPSAMVPVQGTAPHAIQSVDPKSNPIPGYRYDAESDTFVKDDGQDTDTPQPATWPEESTTTTTTSTTTMEPSAYGAHDNARQATTE